MTENAQHNPEPTFAFRLFGWVIALVALFAIPALTADFFPVEDDLLECDDCPACRLQQSMTADGLAGASELPAPVFQRTLQLPGRESTGSIPTSRQSPAHPLRLSTSTQE
jgi:hypothetical protein